MKKKKVSTKKDNPYSVYDGHSHPVIEPSKKRTKKDKPLVLKSGLRKTANRELVYTPKDNWEDRKTKSVSLMCKNIKNISVDGIIMVRSFIEDKYTRLHTVSFEYEE